MEPVGFKENKVLQAAGQWLTNIPLHKQGNGEGLEGTGGPKNSQGQQTGVLQCFEIST